MDIQAMHLGSVDLSGSGTLTTAELYRADSITAPLERRRFLAARIVVREIVAQQVEAEPVDVAAWFHCPRCGQAGPSDHGRPRYLLDGVPIPVGVSFSRSGDWLVCLLSRTPQDLGIDVEDAAKSAFADASFEGVFTTPRERKRLARAGPRERPRFRARLWARKEAALKATGDGLRVDPSTFDAGHPGRPALLDTPTVGGSSVRLLLNDIDTVPLGMPQNYVVSTAEPGHR